VDWTITFLITSVFTMPISSAKVNGHSPHLVFSFSFHFLCMFCHYSHCVHCCACMVHIKFTARPRTPVVSSEIESMALDEALEVFTQQWEASMEQ
jgi:hypothetical protein